MGCANDEDDISENWDEEGQKIEEAIVPMTQNLDLEPDASESAPTGAAHPNTDETSTNLYQGIEAKKKKHKPRTSRTAERYWKKHHENLALEAEKLALSKPGKRKRNDDGTQGILSNLLRNADAIDARAVQEAIGMPDPIRATNNREQLRAIKVFSRLQIITTPTQLRRTLGR